MKKLKIDIESLNQRNSDLTNHLHDLQKFLNATLDNPKVSPSSQSVDKEKSIGLGGNQTRNRARFHLELNPNQNNLCWKPKTSRNTVGLSNNNYGNSSVGNAFYIGRGTISKEHQNSTVGSKQNLGASPATTSLLIPSCSQPQNLQEIFFVPGSGRSKFNLKKSLHEVLQKRGSSKNVVGNHLLIPNSATNKGQALAPRLGRVHRGLEPSSLSARARRTTNKLGGDRDCLGPAQSVEQIPVLGPQPESDRKKKHYSKRSTIANIGSTGV